MKENNFTEKESLELISQMIQQSRRNMEVGSGNILLYYGYPALVLAVAVYLLVHFTHDATWSYLWLLMFLPSIPIGLAKKKSRPQVITHVDKAISSTWRIIGWLFLFSFLCIVAIGLVTENFKFSLMLPLSLLYASIGISITGVMADFKLMTYTPLVGFVAANYMLVLLIDNGSVANWWNLLFGFSFLIMMIIPGLVLNHKIKTEVC